MGGFFIIVVDQANVAGRAWLTLFLVLLFAGAVVLDAQVSDGPNKWYLSASTITNVVIVAVGLMKLWNGWLQGENTSDPGVWSAQFGRLIAVAVLLRLALLVTQLYGLYFVARARNQVGRITASITIGMVWIAALVLAIPASFPAYDWPEWWWRIAGAASLVAVVMAVIPIIIRAFEPRAERPAVQAPAYHATASGYAPAGHQVFEQQPVQQQPVQQQPAAQPAYQPVPPEYQQPAAPVAPAQSPASAPVAEDAPDGEHAPQPVPPQ
jgi:hypothetical protein